MGFDRQVFLMSKKVIESLGIRGFYQSVLSAWSTFISSGVLKVGDIIDTEQK